DSCDGRPGTQGWSYVINAYQFTSARCPATVIAGGCHQLITPSPRFNRLLAPCPRRAQTAGDSRSIAGSSGWPRPAQSSGPPRWIARIKLVPKLTVRVRFPSPAPHAKSVAAVGDSLSLLLRYPSVRPTPEHRWTINGPSVGHRL